MFVAAPSDVVLHSFSKRARVHGTTGDAPMMRCEREERQALRP